jgi:hypothetical protein
VGSGKEGFAVGGDGEGSNAVEMGCPGCYTVIWRLESAKTQIVKCMVEIGDGVD